MKKIALIAACLISTQCFATAVSTAYIDPVVHGQENAYTEIFTAHTYTVTNDTSITQNFQVCYTTTACEEYPSNTKRIFSCDNLTLSAGQTKSGNYTQDLKSVYKFVGWCNTSTATEVKGWIYQISRGAGKLDVTP